MFAIIIPKPKGINKRGSACFAIATQIIIPPNANMKTCAHVNEANPLLEKNENIADNSIFYLPIITNEKIFVLLLL
jgi:hypothetical protein